MWAHFRVIFPDLPAVWHIDTGADGHLADTVNLFERNELETRSHREFYKIEATVRETDPQLCRFEQTAYACTPIIDEQ